MHYQLYSVLQKTEAAIILTVPQGVCSKGRKQIQSRTHNKKTARLFFNILFAIIV